jgi:hypothetical protein
VVRRWDARRGRGTLAARARQHATGRGGFEETTDANLKRPADRIESRGGRSSAGGWGPGKRTRHEGTRLQGDAFSAEDVGLVAARLRAVRPLLDPSLRLDRGVLERWADFDARVGILARRPDAARAFAFDGGHAGSG